MRRRNALRILRVQSRRVERRTVGKSKSAALQDSLGRRPRSGDASRLSAAWRSPCAPSQVSALKFCLSACPWPVQDAPYLGGTSRQSNTHSTELREVRYPWHPWYGRPVWIHGAFVKSGWALYRCSLEQNHEARLFEIPQSMFDSGVCSDRLDAGTRFQSTRVMARFKKTRFKGIATAKGNSFRASRKHWRKIS